MRKNDYRLAKKEITNILKNQKIVSAYEYGSYNNPGLSDIDLFIVLNKKNTELKKILNKLKNSESLKFFFEYSTIMITNENLIKNILLFDDLRLNKLFGKKIRIVKYKKLKKILKILSILEWLPERILKLKKNIIQFKSVNLRQHLGLLNSLKYTLIKTQDFIKLDDIKKYCMKIDSLRKDKNILVKKKFIFNFSKKIFNDSKRLLNILAKNKVINDLKVNIDGELLMKFPKGFKILFTNKKKKTDRKSINVPLIYSLPFSFHEDKKNELSKIVKKNIKKNKKFKYKINNNIIHSILKKRNELINENIKLLVKNNIDSGLYKFGWYYK